MNKKSIQTIILLILVLWIALIFYFSSQPSKSSYKHSDGFIDLIDKLDDHTNITETKIFKLVESFFRDILFKDKYESTSAFVRKSAHFIMYFVLGLISSFLVYLYTRKILLAFIGGLGLPLIIAFLDELNQSFVGRTASFKDVLLDLKGAFAGTSLIILLILIRINYKKL